MGLTQRDEAALSFTSATVIPAEGARVAVVSCLTCGATLLLDPRDTQSMMALHEAWHAGRDTA